MKPPVKFRLLYLLIAIISYTLGFLLIPPSLTSSWGSTPVILASLIYFVFLPILYWFLVIKAGKQNSWKLIIVYSLSCLIAYNSFPSQISQYFEFIMLLRYPIIFVLVVTEFYVIFSVVKGLWQGRKLKGDPRINIINKYKDEDEKKRSAAILFSTEPASWFYAIPKFSQKQSISEHHIKLLSARRSHLLCVIAILSFVSVVCYLLLSNWSEVGALLISGLVFYGVVLFTANYRISRYYSLYIQDNQLILNNSIWGLLVVNIEEIKTAIHDVYPKAVNENELYFGYDKNADIKMEFTRPQIYYGAVGALPEESEQLFVCVDNPIDFLKELNQHMATKGLAE